MRRMLIAFLAAGTILAAVSCSRGNRTIARIDGQKVTIAEFEQVYRSPADAKDTADVAAAKRKMLDQLVDEKLMLCEALARGYDKEPQTARELVEVRNNVLLDWLYREQFIKRNRATDAAVKDLYQKLGVHVRARHIVARSESEARELMNAVKGRAAFEKQFAGKTFDEEVLVPDSAHAGAAGPATEINQIPAGMKLEKRTVSGATMRERFMIVARERSQEEMTAARGGDLFWFGWGQVAPGFDEFQEIVFKLKPGQLGGPVRTPYGHHLVMVDSVKKAEPPLPPLSQIKDQLRMRLDQQAFSKAGEQAQKYVAELIDGAKITVDSAAAAMLADKQRRQYGDGPQPFPDLTAGEQKTTVAAYKGGTVTAADLSDGARHFFRGGVVLTEPDSLHKYAERMITRRLLAARAARLGLDRLPKVKQHIAFKTMDKLAGMVYLREVQEKISIGDQEIRQHYQQHRAEFYRPEQAYVDLILVKTPEEAARTAADLRRGANFAAVARERSLDESRQSGGYLGPVARRSPVHPEIAARAYALPINTVSEPFPTRGGYAVIKVSRRDAARQPGFEEVRDQVRNLLMQRQHDSLLQELVAALKEKYRVTVDERALAAAGQQKDEERP